MAITIVSADRSSGQPSSPQRVQKLVVTLDTSYPTGGYDVSASLLQGATVVASPAVPDYDGSTLRWLKLNAATKKVQVFANNNGSPGAEASAATNVSGHTAVELVAFTE